MFNYLYRVVFILTNRFFFKYRKKIEDSLPVVELKPEHIANLKVLLNRSELLKMMPKNAIIAEIGVFQGEFSEDIVKITIPTKLHLINAWSFKDMADNDIKIVENRLKKEIASGQVLLHNGISTDMLPTFPDEYFDWVYLDTDHSYKTTQKELEILSRKLKANGILAGHDYTHSSYNSVLKYGVIEAVNEFCVKNNWEMLFLTFETRWHYSFAIRRINSKP